MNAIDFKIILERSMPINENFKLIYGYDMPDNFTKMFTLKEKKEVNLNKKFQNEILDEIFSKYHTEYLRFGDYSFNNEITMRDNSLIFCSSSHSYLCLDLKTKKVMEFDLEESIFLNICATSEQNFFESILILFEVYSKRSTKEINRRDASKNEEYIARCVEAAGSKICEGFYRAIIE
jgi:hypothetical protein